MRSPLGLTRDGDDALLLVDAVGGLLLSEDAGPEHAFGTPGQLIRGAAPACSDGFVVLGRETGRQRAGFVGRVGRGEGQVRVIAELSPLRNVGRLRPIPAAIRGLADRVLIFTDEADHPRVLELNCDGSVRSETRLPHLGLPERSRPAPELGRSNRFAVMAPDPPIPAGLVETDDGFLWATLDIVERPSGKVDSVTVFSKYSGGSVTRLRVEQWLLLWDRADDGRILLGRPDADTPHVLVVNGQHLLHLITDEGFAVVPAAAEGNPRRIRGDKS